MINHDDEPWISHSFYQDPEPRELGFCDYTFPNGDYCGIQKDVHPEEED